MPSLTVIGSLLSTAQATAETVTALLFFIAFPIFWCAVIWILAQGGWRQLAEFYRIEQYPSLPTRKSHLQTISINKIRYKGSVTIAYDDYALYMHPILPFRIGHDLLSIPWEEVTVHPKAASRRLFAFDFTRKLTFEQVPNVRVVFPKSLIEQFERFRGVQMLDD